MIATVNGGPEVLAPLQGMMEGLMLGKRPHTTPGVPCAY
jgi:hypothetical protein